MKERPLIYGLMAEFEDPHSLVVATERARQAGFTKLDAYSPYPMEELSEALGLHGNRLPFIVLLGGLAGCAGGYFLQYYLTVVDYPHNVGGRPLNSWPYFLPVAFETTVLVAALAAVLGMLALNGLPMPYHPVFNVPRFALATRDRFFLCIESSDPKFDLDGTTRFLRSLEPRNVSEVPH